MECPTCKKGEGKCCECGKDIQKDEQEIQPDPYASEVYDDKTPHLKCVDCNLRSAYEV